MVRAQCLVTLLVLAETAVARLDAELGIDFFHLAKLDGTRRIAATVSGTVNRADPV